MGTKLETENRQLTVAEVAQVKGVSSSAVYKWVRRNASPFVKRDGRRIFIGIEALASIQIKLTKRSKLHGRANGSPVKDPAPSDADSSPHQIADILSEGSNPRPARNTDCGQRELRLTQSNHFGRGFLAFSSLRVIA
jgi:excisionase family DNA binding protein